MAYFSNGTEGDIFDEQWCSKCLHQPSSEGDGFCPVMSLQLLWNGEQIGDTPEAQAKKQALETLISEDPETWAKTCRMFVPLKAVAEPREARRMREREQEWLQKRLEVFP